MWDCHGWGREDRRTQKRNLHRRKSERENKPLFSKHGMQQQLNNESCKQCWEGVSSYSQSGGGGSREIFLEWHEGGKIQDTMQYIQF